MAKKNSVLAPHKPSRKHSAHFYLCIVTRHGVLEELEGIYNSKFLASFIGATKEAPSYTFREHICAANGALNSTSYDFVNSVSTEVAQVCVLKLQSDSKLDWMIESFRFMNISITCALHSPWCLQPAFSFIRRSKNEQTAWLKQCLKLLKPSSTLSESPLTDLTLLKKTKTRPTWKIQTS